MKLSDYVVSFLEGMTDSVFLLSGGGIMHLVDSVGRSKKLQAVCCHHEQGAATAAEGYGRARNTPGVAMVTTGPGGTNALTGAAGAWLDSVPMLVIAGQVKTDNITPYKDGKPTLRALGFQELNVVDMARHITKYAVTVTNPSEIRYHLENAVYLATHGRPGPVWVEIPLDIQAAQVNPQTLKKFIPPKKQKPILSNAAISKIVSILERAKRPLMLVGKGIYLAGAIEEAWKFVKKTNINVVSTMFNGDDIITHEYPKYIGRQGVPGNPMANWAIDNCDVLLVVGDRLQLTQTSYEYREFATQATIIMVDIDKPELYKKTISIDVPVHADAKDFLVALNKKSIALARWDVPVSVIDSKQYDGIGSYVNAYRVCDVLGEYTNRYDVITANGMASTAPHQALRIGKGKHFMTNAGLGHMGSGLPIALGASIANGKKPVLCMEGDGSIMLNIQELQTVLHHKIPVKLFIWNNNGYFSIRATHQNYFKRIFAADPESGVSLPNFERIITAWGIRYVKIALNQEISRIHDVMKYPGFVVCELMIDPNQPMLPKWTAGQYRDKPMPT